MVLSRHLETPQAARRREMRLAEDHWNRRKADKKYFLSRLQENGFLRNIKILISQGINKSNFDAKGVTLLELKRLGLTLDLARQLKYSEREILDAYGESHLDKWARIGRETFRR